MAAPTLWVPVDIQRKAEALINTKKGESIRDGVELLLKNDLSIGGATIGPGAGRVDAGSILQRGLTALHSNPFEALGVPIGAKTVDIRKAYKKAALKYHPDKNPHTTPLFQAIQHACDKLSDAQQRAAEERNAAAADSRPSQAPYQQQPQPASARGQAQPQSARGGGAQYGAGAGSNNAYGAAAGGYARGNQQQQQKESDEQARRRAAFAEAEAMERKRRQEAANRAKELAEKRMAEARAAAAREEAAKRHREEVLKEGQRAYFEEQLRAREEKLRREREASNAAESARKGMYGAQPTPTPGESGFGNASKYAGVGPNSARGGNPDLRAFRPSNAGFDSAYPKNNPAAYGSAAQRQANPNAAGAAAAFDAYKNANSSRSDPQSSSGTTYTTGPDGKARVHNVYGSKPQAAGGSAGASSAGTAAGGAAGGAGAKKSVVMRPYSLRCATVGPSMVDLEWKISPYQLTPVLIELSWRNTALGVSWESARKLISGTSCRKKNLEAGATYEFRVRAIQDLPGGMLGDRSDWSDTLTVELRIENARSAAQKQQQQQQYQQQNERRDSFSYPNNMRKNSFSNNNYNNEESKFTFAKKESQPYAYGGEDAPPLSARREYTGPEAAKPVRRTSFTEAANEAAERWKKASSASAANLGTGASSATASAAGGSSSAASDAGRSNGNDSGEPNSNSRRPSIRPTIQVKRRLSEASMAAAASAAAAAAAAAKAAVDAAANVFTNTLHGRNKKGNAVSPSESGAGSPARGWKGSNDSDADDDCLHLGQRTKPSPEHHAQRPQTKEDHRYEEGSHDAGRHDLKTKKGVPGGNASNRFSSSRRAWGHAGNYEEEEEVGTDIPGSSRARSSTTNGDDDEDDEEVSEVEEDELLGKSHNSDSDADEIQEEENIPPPVFSPAGKQVGKAGGFFDNQKQQRRDSLHAEEVEEEPSEIWFDLVAPADDKDYEHPVRAEPMASSDIIGYLTPGMSVLAQTDAGNWVKVRIHRRSGKSSISLRGEGWGWAVKATKVHEYLRPVEEVIEEFEDDWAGTGYENKNKKGRSRRGSHASVGSVDDNGDDDDTDDGGGMYWGTSTQPEQIDIWYERYDDEGGYWYYYNETSGESSWESPEWVVEDDAASGASYYVRLNTQDGTAIESTWTKPAKYARLIRYQAADGNGTSDASYQDHQRGGKDGSGISGSSPGKQFHTNGNGRGKVKRDSYVDVEASYDFRES